MRSIALIILCNLVRNAICIDQLPQQHVLTAGAFGPTLTAAALSTYTKSTTDQPTMRAKELCALDIGTAYDYCNCWFCSGPTSGYTVTSTPCPTNSLYARSATGINADEASWLATRTSSANIAMETYLSAAGAPYPFLSLKKDPPRVGLAFSGGGYRAMLMGAGVLDALDSGSDRPVPGVSGLLDSSTYISGLSGGAWFVGSWALRDYPNIAELIGNWNLQQKTLKHIWLEDDLSVCYPVQCEVREKWESLARGKDGNVSYADVWSRLIARQILHGIPANTTWSDLTRSDVFRKGQKPLPIILSTGRTGDQEYEPSGTIYEMTPFEFGSWDQTTTGAFVPMGILGSVLNNGYADGGTCLQGFDNAAFLLGASSLAMTGFLVADLDLSIWESSANVMNPFCGFGSGSLFNCTHTRGLFLDDGGDGHQNIPLAPLLQPSRQIDTIIAVDNSDDSGNTEDVSCGYNWPLGISLNWTLWYANSPQGKSQNIAFPASLPNQLTQNPIYHSQCPAQKQDNPTWAYNPTFLGCNQSESSLPGVSPPLIIYLPNSPYTTYSNATTMSTVTFEYGSVAQELVDNGRALASTGIVDAGLPPWKTCLACAVAERSRVRNQLPLDEICGICLRAYCWETKHVQMNLTDAAGYFEPPPLKGAKAGSGTYNYFGLNV